MTKSLIMDRLKREEDKLNLEPENAHREYAKTKAVLEKKIQLYNQYQVEVDISDVERLMRSNKRVFLLSVLWFFLPLLC